MNKFMVIDVETAPIPDPLLSMIIPPFDPSEVKCGNLKDPEKIDAKLAEARASHFDDYKRNAALSAMTGTVVAIGLVVNKVPILLIDGSEGDLLEAVWQRMSTTNGDTTFTGWNITGFDLPFLMRRSYRHKIRPPIWLREGRWWHRSIVDLLDVFRMGEYTRDEGKRVGYSLNNVAKFLGLGEKSGNGADFAELLKTNREQAEVYLKRDLEITGQIADMIL